MLINRHPANHLIHLNKAMFAPVSSGHRWNPEKFVFADGELAPEAVASAAITKTAHTAVVTWTPSTGAAADDVALVLIYDDQTRKTMHAVATRGAGTATVDVSPLANVSSYTEIYAYLAFASDMENSPTTELLVTVN
jgi:hypothetical protein